MILDILTHPATTAAIGALAGGVFGLAGKRRETAASIQDVWTRSTAALIEQYTKALEASRAETMSLRREIADLRELVEEQTEEIDLLTAALQSHGIPAPINRRRRPGAQA